MTTPLTPEQEALLADGKPHAECFQFDHEGRKVRRIVDDLFGPWEDIPLPHIEIPPPARLSFEPALDRLMAVAERIADALEKIGRRPRYSMIGQNAWVRFPGSPESYLDTVKIANLYLTDDLTREVAPLEPGVTYGVDIYGGSGGVRLKGVADDALIRFENSGRTWLSVKEPSLLSACKAVAGTADVRVVLTRTP